MPLALAPAERLCVAVALCDGDIVELLLGAAPMLSVLVALLLTGADTVDVKLELAPRDNELVDVAVPLKEALLLSGTLELVPATEASAEDGIAGE